MKRFRFPLLVALALTMAVVTGGTLEGCVGARARQNIGLPAMNLAAEGILDDARAGVPSLAVGDRAAAINEINMFQAALASNDMAIVSTDVVVRWPMIRALADKGIEAKLQANQIGPNVAGSLRERLDRFGEIVAKLRTN